MDFYQFFDKLNGKPYTQVAPPVKYKFASYIDAITSSPVNGIEGGASHELRPLTDEDMRRYGSEDVESHFDQLKELGHNPYKLGDQLSDEEFKKFCGMGW